MKLQRNRHGFSLIEVMVAVVVLAIAVAALVRGVSTAITLHKDSERLTIAALIASGRIELLRADGILLEGTTEGTGTDNFANYHWKQTITPTRIEGLNEVTVVVEETESKAKIYELVTQLFDPPLDPLRDKSGVSSQAAKEREQRSKRR